MLSKKVMIILGAIVIGFAILGFGALFFYRTTTFVDSGVLNDDKGVLSEDKPCVAHCKAIFREDVAWIGDAPEKDAYGKLHLKNIYYINFSTGSNRTINAKPVDYIWSIARDGQKFVWNEVRRDAKGKNSYMIRMKDLSTEEEKDVLPLQTQHMVLYQNKLVFINSSERFGSKINTVNIYDVETQQKTVISSANVDENCLFKYYDMVFFVENNKQSYDWNEKDSWLVTYNLTDGVMKKIGPLQNLVNRAAPGEGLSRHSSCPLYNANRVVFATNGNTDKPSPWKEKIFLYDVASDTVTQLAEAEENTGNFIIKDVTSSDIWSLEFQKDYVMYLSRTFAWVGPDDEGSFDKCTLINVHSQEKKDITCKGGIYDWV
jgi:hypothetical protein